MHPSCNDGTVTHLHIIKAWLRDAGDDEAGLGSRGDYLGVAGAGHQGECPPCEVNLPDCTGDLNGTGLRPVNDDTQSSDSAGIRRIQPACHKGLVTHSHIVQAWLRDAGDDKTGASVRDDGFRLAGTSPEHERRLSEVNRRNFARDLNRTALRAVDSDDPRQELAPGTPLPCGNDLIPYLDVVEAGIRDTGDHELRLFIGVDRDGADIGCPHGDGSLGQRYCRYLAANLLHVGRLFRQGCGSASQQQRDDQYHQEQVSS